MTTPLQAAQAAIRSIAPYTHAVAKAEAMFAAWVEAFAPILETHDVLAVEKEFSFALLNPDTESPSKTFAEAGKIDGVLRCKSTGAVKVLEHKTTSDAITPGSDYWARLEMDSQISKYVLALMNEGHEVRSVVYDVAKKPAHRPLRAGKSDEETPDEFRERCLEAIRDTPGDYFSQREIPRSDTQLLEYCRDAWALSQQILYYRRESLWPRNTSACVAFGRCEFFDLCAGRSEVDGIRFRHAEKKHAELNIQADGKRELLTNSRLGALRKCARYHFLRYESPTERIDERSEALAMGSAFHLGCETYLKAFLL